MRFLSQPVFNYVGVLFRTCAQAAVFLTGLYAAGLLSAGEFTTYIGDLNVDLAEYKVVRVVADSAGNSYVGVNRHVGGVFGRSPSSTDPPFGYGIDDLLVMKLDPSGKVVISTSIGAPAPSAVNDLALDAAGNIYIGGSTSSAVFPVHNGFRSTPGRGFIAKISAGGGSVAWSTYFPEVVTALAVDGSGNLYVAGTTIDPNFPATPAISQGRVHTGASGRTGAFLTKISAAGNRILYSAVFAGGSRPCVQTGSTCILSNGYTWAIGAAVDPSGNAYLIGSTDSYLTPAGAGRAGIGGFVVKIDSAGTAISYLTSIGTSYSADIWSVVTHNSVSAVAVDSSGDAVITGYTSDGQFSATPGAYQPQAGDGGGPFALKLGPDGSVLWATYFGGKGYSYARAAALDASNNIWLSGTTNSADFPTTAGTASGGDFVLGLNSSGSALLYAALLPGGIASKSVAVDPTGLLLLAGSGSLVSAVRPTGRMAPRTFGIANAASGPIGARISSGEVISIYGAHIGPSQPITAIPDSSGTYPTNLGGVLVSVQSRSESISLALLYVSDSQINAVAPLSRRWYADPDRIGMTLRVTTNGVTTPDFAVARAQAAPQLFQDVNGNVAAVNEDGSINSSSHPAKPGTVVSVWATGVGFLPADLSNGKIVTTATDTFCCAVYGLGAGWPGQEPVPISDVLYAGTAPGLVAGIAQINFRAPSTTTFQFFIVVDSHASNWVRIYVAR